MVDVDLAELGSEQQPLEDEPPTSLRLEHVQFPGIERPIVCDTSVGRPRVLVPVSRRHRIFQAVHDLAHPSGKTTLSMISRAYVWPNMRRDVQQWARQCRACATSKVAIHTRPSVLPIQVPASRFEPVHFDLVGPFTPSRGFKYILTIIDRTTRWPEALPIADTTSETVVQAFLDRWMARFGVPVTVTSDRGTQFSSGLWRRTLEKLGINVTTTTSYHPQSNGLVERFHRTLKNALRCAVRMSESWAKSLPWVLLGIRNAPRGDTSTSTAEVLYGTPLRVPGLCFQAEQSRPRTAIKQLVQARSNVETFLPQTLDLRKFKASPFIARAMRTATHVYIRDDRLGKPSLAPRYTGPFKVIRKDWQNNKFMLQLGNKQDEVSLSRLKAATMQEEAT